jgi:hypothetical protein
MYFLDYTNIEVNDYYIKIKKKKLKSTNKTYIPLYKASTCGKQKKIK